MCCRCGDDLATFCFAQRSANAAADDTGLGQLTLYCLGRSGAIYAACPVIPYGVHVDPMILASVFRKVSQGIQVRGTPLQLTLSKCNMPTILALAGAEAPEHRGGQCRPNAAAPNTARPKDVGLAEGCYAYALRAHHWPGEGNREHSCDKEPDDRGESSVGRTQTTAT